MAILSASTTTVRASNQLFAETLRGVDRGNELNFDGVEVSFGGGANLMIADKGGMYEDPSGNKVRFKTNSLGAETTLPGADQTQDDIFQSSPVNGRLHYTLPSATDLVPGVNMEDFKSLNSLNLDTQVYNLATLETLVCASYEEHLCRIRMNWNWTPIIYGVQPQVLYYGQVANIRIDPREAPRAKKDTDLPVTIKLDGFRMDHEDYLAEEENLHRWSVQTIQGVVQTTTRNVNAELTAHFNGVGKAVYNEVAATTCDITGTDCYKVRTVPSIASVDVSAGYSTGGQELTITGYSLDANESLEVMVGDEPCTITESGRNQIKCLTSPAPNNLPAYHVGSNGLYHARFNNTNEANANNFQDYLDGNGVEQAGVETIATSFEITATHLYYHSYDHMNGYFEAPVDGAYQFHVTCDDSCKFFMSPDSDPMNPEAKVQLTHRGSHTSYRDHHSFEDDVNSEEFSADIFTEWINLTGGQFYYVEAQMKQGNGWVHLTVGVEIEPSTPIADHPMQKKQKHSIKISQGPDVLKLDTTKITVSNAAAWSGNYTLALAKLADENGHIEMYMAEGIIPGGSASNMWHALIHYYRQVWGSEIDVTEECFDVNGALLVNNNGDMDCEKTEISHVVSDCLDSDGNSLLPDCNPSEVVQTITDEVNTKLIESKVYTVTVLKSITGPSCDNVIVAGLFGGSVTVTLPSEEDGTLSSMPISGEYFLICYDHDDNPHYTTPIHWTWNAGHVHGKLVEACPFLRDGIFVSEGWEHLYNENGIDFTISYPFINGSLKPIEVWPEFDNPIIGDGSADGSDIIYEFQVEQPYGPNIMYEAIPFEMLRTAHDKPQVKVIVDNQPAVCKPHECDFTYIEPSSEVTSMSISGLDVTIAGTGLPFGTDILSVTVSMIDCQVSASSSSSISCTLQDPLVHGDWTPEVRDANGLAPMASGFNIHHTTGTILDVSPKTELNKAGGELITITGTGFPASMYTAHDVLITFSSGNRCKILSMTSTEIQCETEPFETSSSRRRMLMTASLNIEFNGNGLNPFNDITLRETDITVDQITPSSASPILQENLVIQLSSSYDNAGMDDDTFTVSLYPQDPENTFGNIHIKVEDHERFLNVIDQDAASRTITVKYNGAYSGVYDLRVKSLINGNVLTSSVTFEAKIEVTSFSPKQGSLYGGTLLTINGGHFSDVITDNPVKVGYKYWSNGHPHWCFVQSSSDNEIKCRIMEDWSREAGQEEVIVFAGTFEEATYADTNDRYFEFLDAAALPTITDVSADFTFSNSDKYKLLISGTNIQDTSTDTVEVFVGDVKQTTTIVSSNLVEVQIDDIPSGSTDQSLRVYFELGLPNDMNSFNTVTFDPRFIGLTRTTGSNAGAVIQAKIAGVGTEDNITLIDENNNDMCETSTVLRYGILECEVAAGDHSNTQVRVKNLDTNGLYPCYNDDQSECRYSTTATLEVTAVTQSSSTEMVLVGVDAQFTTDSCMVAFVGVAADDCNIDNANQITAIFDGGIPTSDSTQFPELRLIDTSGNDDIELIANNAEPAGIKNEMTVTEKASINCGFGGGCTWSADVNGLTSNIRAGEAQIQVCGKECTLDEELSNDTEVHCKVPFVQTVGSRETFTIVEAAAIRGPNIVESGDWSGMAFDGNNIPGVTGSQSNCYIGTEFTEGFVGYITEVRFFMDYFTDRENRVRFLKFQGSNLPFDNPSASIEDIVVVDEEIHEGWNYYDLSDNPRKYAHYRMFNQNNNGCDNIGEIKLIGQEVIDNSANSHGCSVKITRTDEETVTLSNPVIYVVSDTPYLTSISPRWGSVEGGTTVTFTGEHMSNNVADISIKIDNVVCAVQTASRTEVTCITGARIGAWNEAPRLEMTVSGGNIVDQGHIFRYVSLWSSPSTWGFQGLPMKGESVSVPAGLNLLVDVDTTPELNLVIVDGGSIIFPTDADPNHQREFHAHYIFVNNGYFEAGTEDEPYTSKLTITMYGDIRSPYMPIYGNKCIGVRYSTLDIHGETRTPTWTELESTVMIGDNQIILREAVDWRVGEEIIIASTDFDKDEAEKKTIAAIDRSDPNKPVLTLDTAFNFKHYAGIDFYGTEGDFIEIRAEVGLLTRNIKYQGDAKTSEAEQYGAHILIHSPGDESTIGRIAYTEFFNVGQAFQMGRYPIHYHMIGTVHKSYILGNTVHQSYNRGTTVHGVHYLRILKNVYYDTMGHTVFIEDAIETKNRIEENLVVAIKPSFSLLNTDSTPACFWITHPNNIFVGNHAAGGPRYGFWFDAQDHPIGPSATNDICPPGEKLGEFRDNVAHSVGRYGLRIHHGQSPRTFGCKGISFDEDAVDPYWQNPIIPARFENFLSYKNGRNGVMGAALGAVEFHNIKTADNRLAGIEIEIDANLKENTGFVDGALIVGRTLNNMENSVGNPRGIITPRTDKWWVKNVKFFNFNFGHAAALGSCSHCFHPAATDSDARTIKFANIFMDPDTVTKKVLWQFPYKGIFHDTDGSWISEKNSVGSAWASSMWGQNLVDPACEASDVYDGIICDGSVTIRRLVMYRFSPGSLENRDLYILPYDDSILAGKTTEEIMEYEANGDPDNGLILTQVPFRKKTNPFNHWAVPIVTGHKYLMRWEFGLDFETMRFEIENYLWENDPDIELELPFFDQREAITVDTSDGERIANNTIAINARFGANLIRNDTELLEEPELGKRMNLIINSDLPDRKFVDLTGWRCVGTDWNGECDNGDVEQTEVEDTERRWSNVAAWEGQFGDRIPTDDDDVVIQPSWNMIYDLPVDGPIPKLKSLQINGVLTFEDTADRLIKSHSIWVRQGTLNIGSEEQPFVHKATITLLGDNLDHYWAFTNSIEAGNKNLVVTGTANIYGTPALHPRSRLHVNAFPTDTQIFVDRNMDWKAGDKISIAATNMRTMDLDHCVIQEYIAGSGMLTCTEPLKGFHFGRSRSTVDEYGVDMRAEVSLLERNVEINASTDDIGYVLQEPWGCRILVSDFFEANLEHRVGSLFMDSVSVYNCSQKATWKAAITWEQALMGRSKISRSVLHNGKGVGIFILSSQNIELDNNDIISFVEKGVWAKKSSRLTISDNWVHDVIPWVDEEPLMFQYPQIWPLGAMTISEQTSHVVATGNVVSGSWHHGFHFTPDRCDGSTSNKFENNVAHSVSGYGAIAKNVPNDCTEVKNFWSYKVTEAALMLGGPSLINRATNVHSIDTRYGIAVHTAADHESSLIEPRAELHNCKVYSELMDNMDCAPGQVCDHCIDRTGMVLNQATSQKHDDFQIKWPKLPLFKGSGNLSGAGYYYDMEFIGFTSKTTTCGSRQQALSPYVKSPDYVPYSYFYNPKFINQAKEALAFIPNPDQGWANPTDCVEFTCTGLYNIVIYIENPRYSGDTIPIGLPTRTFSIISNNVEEGSISAQAIPNCNLIDDWNAYACETDDIGTLIFDSKDPDRQDRASQPIWISNDELCRNFEGENVCFNNKLNAYMDHGWDGFYTSQKREQRFPSLVDLREHGYNVTYTGTPASKQEFRLYGQTSSQGIEISIYYPNAGAYSIYNQNMHLVEPTDWDHSAETWGAVTGQRGCGENRYEGVINRLQFWLEPGCRLHVIPRDAIMLGIRMEFTVAEFYAQGGVTVFADRMAAVLGIHASDIKVVSVYEGSTIVDFFVTQAEDLRDALDLDKVEETFVEAMEVLDEFMGSPILNAVHSGVQIATKHSGEIETVEDVVNLWDDVIQEIESDEPRDQDISIEVVYRTQTQGEGDEHSRGMVTAYIIMLLALIVIIIVVMLIVCFYNRIAIKINIEKTAERTNDHKEGKLERRMSLQYDPKDDLGDIYSSKGSARHSQRSGSPAGSARSTRPFNKENEAPVVDCEVPATPSDQDNQMTDVKRKHELEDSAVGPVFDDGQMSDQAPQRKANGKNPDEIVIWKP